MSSARRIILLAGVAALASLALPGVASAGTYSWSQPSDFTTTAPGANPEHKYGAPSWSYSSSTGALTFSSNFDGGLSGWSDNPSSPTTFIAVNPSSQLEMLPAQGQSVTLGWASPFSQSTTVTVTGSVTYPNASLCSESWSLGGGSSTKSGTGNGTINTQETVSKGASLDLTLTDNSNLITYSASCATAVVSLQITAPGTPPAVSLASPANGAVISGGQPTFSGSASTGFGSSNQVTVRVYRGTTASGTPIETLTATPSGGSYAVGPSPPLADGRYTAQAEQDDLVGDHGFSAPVGFTVENHVPTVTLSSLGSRPLLTSTPTISGTAGDLPGYSSTVAIDVYPGASASGTPAQTRTAIVGANGQFSVKLTPGLPDGRYTVVASQSDAVGTGSSSPLTFRIKVHAPAVTLTEPAAGQRLTNLSLVFGGAAGTALGDSSQVTITLHRGSSAGGKPLGTLTVTAHGATWSARWPGRLRPGRYTVRATQRDDAGHTGASSTHTFTIVPIPPVIGSSVTLDRFGYASVRVGCPEPAAVTCTGDVLALTVRTFRPSPGGPAGEIELLFAYVSIPGGQSKLIRQPLPAAAARTLRRAGALRVRVIATLSLSSGATTRATGLRKLRRVL